MSSAGTTAGTPRRPGRCSAKDKRSARSMRKAEMGRFNISPDEDSSSYSSNSDFNYSYPSKQAAMKSHYADVDPENQNFLLESNLGKKKYETDFVSCG